MLVVCTGTGTEVGKTWVGAAVLARLAGRGVTVSARKPLQSFDPDDGVPTDAAVLAAATGESPDAVCPPERSYPVPMAPPMAADVLRRDAPRLEDIVAGLRWPEPAPMLRWVESVGGVRSPLTDDGDTVDLCARLRPDVVVLVADAGLGTINSVRLSVAALGSDAPVLVVLNRFDPADDLHRRNRDWLADRCGLDVLTSVDDLARRLFE